MPSVKFQFPEGDTFFSIRESLITICGGNHCAASILDCLIYWNGVREKQIEQELVHANSDPTYKPNLERWIYKSTSDWVKDLHGHYGEDSIRSAILILKEDSGNPKANGYVEIRDNPRSSFDKTRQYRLDKERVKETLSLLFSDTRKIGHRGRKNGYRDGEKRVSLTEITSGTEITSDSENKAEPPTPFETENQSQPPEIPPAGLDVPDLLKNLGSRFKNLKGSGGFQKPLRDLLESRLFGLSDLSTRQVYDAFDCFCSESFWVDYDGRHRVNAFFAYLNKGEWACNHPRAESETGVGSIPRATPVPNSLPVAPGSQNAQSETFPARWNRLVPSSPVEWNERMDGPLLAATLHNPDFAARFDDTCRKAQTLLTADPEGFWYLNFRWLLRVKDGMANWWKIASGELQPKPKAAAKSKLPDASTWAANIRRKAEEKKNHETNP